MGCCFDRALAYRLRGSADRRQTTDGVVQWVRGVTLTMVDGKPTLVVWCLKDLREGLKAAADTGLPLTSPQHVADRVLGLLLPCLTDDMGGDDRV